MLILPQDQVGQGCHQALSLLAYPGRHMYIDLSVWQNSMQVQGLTNMSSKGRKHCYLVTHTVNLNNLLAALHHIQIFFIHYFLDNLYYII